MRANTHASSGKRAALAVTLIFSASAGIAACGSDTNEKPPPTTFTTSSTTGAGAGSTTTATAATGAGGAAATTTTTTGNGGATATTATGAGGAGGQPDCHGPNDCYKCAPKTEPQFLNACTDSQCSPFDNVARLPLYNNGNLPPIP